MRVKLFCCELGNCNISVNISDSFVGFIFFYFGKDCNFVLIIGKIENVLCQYTLLVFVYLSLQK